MLLDKKFKMSTELEKKNLGICLFYDLINSSFEILEERNTNTFSGIFF